MVICLQSFKRGLPLLPATADEPICAEIDCGADVGLRRWRRYEAERFHLGPYLESNLEGESQSMSVGCVFGVLWCVSLCLWGVLVGVLR